MTSPARPEPELTPSSGVHHDPLLERATVRKVAFRLVPFVAVMFFINYLDRTAISFAGPNGMNHDLGLSAAQYGFASGVFFIGYVLLEVPSNLILHRVGARKWLARIMVTWGIVDLLVTWVGNYPQLVALRLLLGITEAGFFPGVLLYLSLWIPARHRSKILAFFYMAQPLTTVIGAPLAAAIMSHGALGGLTGWRLMFLVVSIPAILMGIGAWFYLADAPGRARWLTEPQRAWLTATLAAEDAAKPPRAHGGIRAAFGSGRVWTLAIMYFGIAWGTDTLVFFVPTIVDGFQKQFGTTFDTVQQGLITAICYLPAVFALYFWSRDSERRGVRTWHVAIPLTVGALSIPAALIADSATGTVIAVAIGVASIFAGLPSFWTLPTRFLSGAAAATGLALINTIGNIAGFAAPYATGALDDATGGLLAPMIVAGALMLLSAALMVILARHPEGGRGAPAVAAKPADSAHGARPAADAG